MKTVEFYNNDEALVLGIRNQENAALNFLYKNYFRMIKEFVLKNSGSYDDAKDVFQECVISLVEKLIEKPLVLTSSFKTYFYSMCRYNWLKKIKGQNRFIKIQELSYEIADEIKENFDNEIKFEKLNLLASLGEKCQEILRLYYYNQISMADIALKMNYTNADNVKNQKFKCVEQLKKKIKTEVTYA